jgi:hypothetical protein
MNNKLPILYFLGKNINQDIDTLITCLHTFSNNNIDLKTLKERYKPNIITHNPKKKTNKFKSKFKLKQKERCMARCWGGKSSVKYNPLTKKWIYGTQCKKYSVKNNYCLMHYKQTLRSYGISHGDIRSPPPHLHYLKYKQKIIETFGIKH